MKGIGGNITATVQVYTSVKNEIGEYVKDWPDVQNLRGWLDMQSGEAKNTSFNAKIQESTHIFIADYVELDSRISAENSRLMIGGKPYYITLIDNPMELGAGSQLEIYLKFTGG